nr:MAG TPA: Protein of unknown function (DUF1043) [Caudoviricetes sp.]
MQIEYIPCISTLAKVFAIGFLVGLFVGFVVWC